MYYFIGILYTISAVSSFSFQIDESVNFGVGSNSDLNDSSNTRSFEHNSDSDKEALISHRRDFAHPVTRRKQYDDPSLWHSLKSFGPDGKLPITSDESYSSESEDESDSNAIFEIPIIKPIKSFVRTPKRTQKALYKTTRVHSSWTKSFNNGRNRMNKTKGRNKRYHRQKKYIARQDLNKKLNAVGLYMDNVRQIFYNKTHYSPYTEPLYGTYNINDLWNKQHIVKPFDESFKLPSNRPRDRISVLGGERYEKKIKYEGAAANRRPKINNNVTDFHLNTVELSKTNPTNGTGRTTDSKYRIPKDMLVNITLALALREWKDVKSDQELKKDVVSTVNAVKNAITNLFQRQMKRNTADKNEITVKTAELLREIEKEVSDLSFILPSEWVEQINNVSEVIVDVAIVTPMNFISGSGNKIGTGHFANETAKGVENIWQKNVQPNIDHVNDKLLPGLQQETEKAAQTVVNGTVSLWQDNLKPKIDSIKDKLTPDILKQEKKNATQAQSTGKGRSNLWQPWMHRVRDDVKVNTFMNHILRHKLKIFNIIEKQRRDKNWKTYVRYLAKTYEDKFKEFIRDTSQHKIKSRMGHERVILNSIGVSNRIITRLVNFAMDDMKKKGLLIENSVMPKMVGEKINEETNTVLEQVCSNLNACRHRNGFIHFISDFFTTISRLDSDKFELATSALTTAVRRTDLTAAFDPNISKRFKDKITTFDSLPFIFKLGAFNVMKNIVTNSNSPLVVYGDSEDNIADKTVAMLDIMYTLDQKVLLNAENVKQWNSMRTDLNNFALNRNQNIKAIMFAFVEHVKKIVERTDADTKNKILNSAKLFL